MANHSTCQRPRTNPLNAHPLMLAYVTALPAVLATHRHLRSIDSDELAQGLAERLLVLIRRGVAVPQNPNAYVKQVARFLVKEMLRADRRRSAVVPEAHFGKPGDEQDDREGVLDGFAPEPGQCPSEEDYLEQRDAIARALQIVTPGEADAIMRRLFGYGPPEGSTEGAQNVLICRAKKRLEAHRDEANAAE